VDVDFTDRRGVRPAISELAWEIRARISAYMRRKYRYSHDGAVTIQTMGYTPFPASLSEDLVACLDLKRLFCFNRRASNQAAQSND
jgi:hypothetical protein